MAFVYRSEKISSLSPKKDNYDIGPGQYLAQSNNVPVKKNKAPFMTSSLREKEISIEKQLPGPGSYYRDETFEKYFKNIQQHKMVKNEQLINYNALKNLNDLQSREGAVLMFHRNSEILGFLAKDKRFKDTKQSETPGPGYYISHKDRSKTSNLKNRSLSLQNKLKTNNKLDKIDNDKIVSIPYKHQTFGYDVDEEGKIVMNEDPEKFMRFRGEKNDTVGPGNYEIDKPEDWLKKGTEWSKWKSAKFSPIEKRENTNKKNRDMKLSHSFDGINDRPNNENNNLLTSQNRFNINKLPKHNPVLKNNAQRKNNRLSLIKDLMQNNEPVDLFGGISKQMMKDTPGPGYYYNDKSMNPFKSNKYPEVKQNFLSNLNRFQDQNINETVGPGTYFRDNDSNALGAKKLKQIKEGLLAPITKKTKLRMMKTMSNFHPEKIETPGPGQYDPSKDFNKNQNFSTQSHFGSTEKRFVEFGKLIKSTTPGPGSYIESLPTVILSQNSTKTKWINFKSQPFKSTFTNGFSNMSSTMKEKKIKKDERIINANSNNKDIIPPVGTYYPENMFNIENKIKKNVSKMSMVEAVFNSTLSKNRFDDKKIEDTNIGPGYYYKEKKAQNTQIFPPFRNSEVKFNKPKTAFNLGPGNYNQASYFDWNKKTFNILYL